jgi:hypothetical protein
VTTEKYNTVDTTALYFGLLGFGSGISVLSVCSTVNHNWFIFLVLGAILLVAGSVLISIAFEGK